MVYFSKVRDLLNPATLKIKGGLKVRQHPKLGFYGKTFIRVSILLNYFHHLWFVSFENC